MLSVVCAHCRTTFNPHQQTDQFNTGRRTADGLIAQLRATQCPQCLNVMVELEWHEQRVAGNWEAVEMVKLYPRRGARASAAPEVDPAIATDYNEACLVAADSPKAAAALGRRCLQNLLREKAGVKSADLSKEIQQVLDEGHLPSYLADSLDAVRNIGNFAAHPVKSRNSGEVVPVEAGEADWILDTLEALFDFFYVQPVAMERKRAALNEKLEDAGKPALKGGDGSA